MNKSDPAAKPALSGAAAAADPTISAAVNPAVNPLEPVAGIGDTAIHGVTPAQRGGRMPPSFTVPLPGTPEAEALEAQATVIDPAKPVI